MGDESDDSYDLIPIPLDELVHACPDDALGQLLAMCVGEMLVRAGLLQTIKALREWTDKIEKDPRIWRLLNVSQN